MAGGTRDAEAMLRAAIAADPDDEAPRLAYADWLMERGDPRGQLIAVQCAIERGDAAPGAQAVARGLLDRHADDWLAAIGLRPGEGTFASGFVDSVDIDAARGPDVVARVLDLPLRELCLRTDFGGNDDELLAVGYALAARLPVGFRRLMIDRRRHWDDNQWNDTLAVAAGGARIDVELGQCAGPRPAVPVLAALLDRHRDIDGLDIELLPRGPVDIDDIIDALVAVGGSAVRSFAFSFVDYSGRDWMRWLRCRRIGDLLALYPSLSSLSLPMAELWVDRFDHASLRELELHWLGMTPMGPKDPWNYGRPERGSGLTFLRTARLPALERLGIDLQYDWYVPWDSDDITALCEADLPRLTRLSVLYGLDGENVGRQLLTARFAAQLEHLDLTGTDMDDDMLELWIRNRAAFPRLHTLVYTRPLDATDEAWRALRDAYPVVEPD